MICSACQAWIEPIFQRAARISRCPECGHVEPHRFLPLFIVTGPSGAGKSAVVGPLQLLLPDWEVFETDILRDSAGDWNTVKGNWLRIADSLAQRPHGRPTILCGTFLPQDIHASGFSHRIQGFSTVNWLALCCGAEVLAARLRMRPPWRGVTEEFIASHQELLHWFEVNAELAFNPPLTLLSTTGVTPSQTAKTICDWAVGRWQQEVESA